MNFARVISATMRASVVFSRAGRPGKNYGRQAIGFDGATEEFAGSKNMFLTDELFECSWAHARGERCCARAFKIRFFLLRKKIVHP